jgi:hypothetical protein
MNNKPIFHKALQISGHFLLQFHCFFPSFFGKILSIAGKSAIAVLEPQEDKFAIALPKSHQKK